MQILAMLLCGLMINVFCINEEVETGNTVNRKLQSMQLPLFYRMDGRAPVAIDAGADDTIGELRWRVLDFVSMDGDHLSISLAGKELLNDEQTLADAAICAQSVIDIQWVLANGYYRFVGCHLKRLLTAMEGRYSSWYLRSLKDSYKDDQIFFLERQSCGSYTIRCKQNGLYWTVMSNVGAISLLSDWDNCARPDAHLFKFAYHGLDKWSIVARRNGDMVNNFGMSVCTDWIDSELEFEDAHVSFKCEKVYAIDWYLVIPITFVLCMLCLFILKAIVV